MADDRDAESDEQSHTAPEDNQQQDDEQSTDKQSTDKQSTDKQSTDKQSTDKQSTDKQPTDKQPAPVSAAEWVAAAAGLAIVATVVALLVREAATSAHRPPDVTVRADSVVRGRGGWLVLYTARNGGDATAAALTLRATHAAGADTLERDAQIDYLPARSERRGGFLFPRDPRAGTLTLEAVGYEEP